MVCGRDLRSCQRKTIFAGEAPRSAIAAFPGGDAARVSDAQAREVTGFDLGVILADLDRLAG
jgi:hypothetical protein